MKRKTNLTPKPIRSSQVPVTVAMLNEMEGRLSHKIDAGLRRVQSEISGVKADVSSLKSDVSSLKSDVSTLKTDVSSLKSEFSGFKSELHRVALLVEEQNARNKYVLDGYAQLYELIERKLG